MLLAHVDVETTGTDPDRHEVWEVAVVLEEDQRVVGDWSAFVEPQHLGNADPGALQIGGFYRRYPDSDSEEVVLSPSEAAAAVAKLTAEAVVVGAGVHFDAAFLRRMLIRAGYAPAWHYALVDVKAVAAGILGLQPPWSTDQILQALDIDPQKLGIDRHTARGDVEVNRAIYHMALVDRVDLLRKETLGMPAGWPDRVPPPVEADTPPGDTAT